MTGKSILNTELTLSHIESCLPIFQYIDSHFEEYVKDAIAICEVPAPTFDENKRASYFAEQLLHYGIASATDEVGNVEAHLADAGRPRVVLSAHLDTVFPFQAISVSKENTILRAPGIADDSAGLSALLLLGRAFLRFPRLKGSLTLLATVGEEGLGNLRGARHFFSHHDEIDYFISLDGSDAQRIVTQGLASKRLRIFFRGPGGHSWADAGTSNPVYPAAEFLMEIKRHELPLQPKATINVGVIRGGTSVNAIPAEVSLDLDFRSESADQLVRLLDAVQRNLDSITNRNKEIHSEIVLLGDRPAGAISQDHPMVWLTTAASEYFGMSLQFVSGSTDCNVPLSIGIPALSFGVGGRCGKIHTPQEWYDYSGGETGLKRTALLVSELLEAK